MAYTFTQTLEGEGSITHDFCMDPPDHESKLITYPVRWKISDYRALRLKSGSAIRSPPFLLGPKDEYEVCLALYPRGDPGSRTDQLASIFVQYLSGTESWITGNIEFKIDNQAPKETSIGVDTFIPGLGWGIREFCHHQDLNGKSCIICIVSYIISKASSLKKKVEHQVRVLQDFGSLLESAMFSDVSILFTGRELKVSEDFGSLLESAMFSDVSILISGRELKAHKLVLATRSPVFKAMLESNMSETTTNTINISDIEVKVMQQLLSYIYTGKLNEFLDTAEGLLVAADKYCMEELKTECGELLCRNVCVDNAARLFLLAEMHGVRGLRNKCVEYIKMNMQTVKTTDDWKTLKQGNCKLIVETFVE